MKPVGTERARRWLAALAMVPEDERDEVIERVEAAILEQYDPSFNETYDRTPNDDRA